MKIIKVKNLKDAQGLMRKHNSQKPEKLVVKYYMDGCGACQDFEPKWQNVIQKLDFPSSIMIADVENNAQEHLPIPSKMGFPTLSILNIDRDGSFSEEDEHIGSMQEDKLMEILTKVISSQSGGKRRKKPHKKRTRKHKRVKGRKSRKTNRRSNKRKRR
jgi:hypothetical protein